MLTLKGFAMCGLCAKYFQPHIAKPVLSTVFLTNKIFKNENNKI